MLLVVDNYDSFTFNLVQFLGELGQQPVVVRNDARSVVELAAMRPERIVLSPGPCTPREAGVSIEVVRELGPTVPILGVCLGHQAIGEAYGGRTVRARRIMHGKTCAVRHTGQGLFAGLPQPLTVTRYHSLVTDPEALPDVLEPVAWSDEDDGAAEVQAMKHRAHPVWGVQFHPESLFSEGGRDLLRNFLDQ
jgi:anthranilate synthase component 2